MTTNQQINKMLNRDKLVIVCQCSGLKNNKQFNKICSNHANCLQINVHDNNYVFNDQKRAIIALGNITKPTKGYDLSRSVKLQATPNPESQQGKFCRFLKSSHSIKRKNSLSQSTNIQKERAKVNRSASEIPQKNNKNLHAHQTANIINIASVGDKKTGKPLSMKYKSNYCKRITMSNLEKYYQYCVSRLQDKVIDLEEEAQLTRKDFFRNERDQRLSEMKKMNEELRKSYSQNIEKGQPMSNLLREPEYTDSQIFQPSKRYSFSRGSDYSRYRGTKQGRYSVSQNCNRTKAYSFLQKDSKNQIDKRKKKGDTDLSPWDAPDPNFQEFQA